MIVNLKEELIKTLERFPETRKDRLELVRRYYYMKAKEADVSLIQIDTTINTLRAFARIQRGVDYVLRELRDVQNVLRPDLKDSTTAAERDALEREYRDYYSPKIDPDQTTLF